MSDGGVRVTGMENGGLTVDVYFTESVDDDIFFSFGCWRVFFGVEVGVRCLNFRINLL